MKPNLKLSIVLPTYNERDNIAPIVAKLTDLANDYRLEVLFVDDDSADGTADEILRLSRCHHFIRLVRRIGRFGLSSAIKEGLLNATGELVVVMDSDGQHEPAAVRELLEQLRSSESDLVIGSRFHAEAAILGLSQQRQRNSNLANRVARFSLPGYRRLTDYMSGFFGLVPERCLPWVRQVDVNGFKFLYELLAVSHGQLKVSEIPLSFQPRTSGESKLNLAVVWDLGLSILHTLLGRLLPRRAISFALVGGSGVLLHLLLYGLARRLFGFSFEAAQALAVVATASSNYLINNRLTFRAQQLKGPKLIGGLVRFLVVTSLGMVANIGVSSAFLHRVSHQTLLAVLAGIAVDFVWKYAASSRFVWNTPS